MGYLEKYVIILTSSVHIDIKHKCILILGKGPAQVLDRTTLTSEA